MISNYYILHQVANELRPQLIGRRFVRAYSLHPGELLLVFDADIIVTAVLVPAQATLYLNTSAAPSLPKRNSISFFKELQGLAVTDVLLAHDDKRLTICFADLHLVLRFYDSPNAVLYHEGTVQASFKKEHPPKVRTVTEPDGLLRRTLPMLGKHLEKEFYARYTEATEEAIAAFDTALRSSAQAVVYKDTSVLLLSPIRLSTKVDGENISPSEGVEFVLRNRRRLQGITERKQRLRKRLLLLLGRTAKAIDDTSHGLEEHAREHRYRHIAEALQFQASEFPKGSSKTTLEIDGKIETLSLDPLKSAYENAAYYFNKAKYAAEARIERAKQLDLLQRNRVKIEQFLSELDLLLSIKDIEAFERSLKTHSFLLEKADESAERSGDELDRYRRFIVAGGFEVLAGKNAKQNDELTMKVANKDDLWFHARHVSGSHVVLRRAGRKDIPKEAIMQAAQIAAFYSDAKTQKVAPVAYTARKFVRKRKGAVAGEVIIEKEEVVMVEPKA